MNSSSARVTAAVFVRSPLTATARSRRSGSIARLVAMCEASHKISHSSNQLGNPKDQVLCS